MSNTQINDTKSCVGVQLNVAANLSQFLSATGPSMIAQPAAGSVNQTSWQWSSDPTCAYFFATMQQCRDVLAALGVGETAAAVPLCALASWTMNGGSTTGATGCTGQTITVP